MIEDQLRDGLRSAVTDEPPLGFDPLAAADQARRAVRRRRAVLASGAATVLLMGGTALAVSVTRDSPAPEWAAAVPASQKAEEVVPAKPWPTPPANPPVPADPHGIGAAAAGIGKYLVGQLPVVVPGAENIEIGGFGQEMSGDFSGDPGSFNGPIFYDDALGRAVLVLTVSASGAGAACEGSVPPDACTTSGLPDGSALETIEHTDTAQPNHRVLSVRHLRVDGSSVQFSTYTYDGFSREPSPLVRGAYPVTTKQLTALATDTNITL